MSGQKKPKATPLVNKLTNQEDSFSRKDRIDFVFKVIGRFDFYINSTNTKASLIIAWNGVMLGAFLLRYKDLLDIYPTGWPRYVAIGLLCLLGLATLMSIGFIVDVALPYMKSTSTDNQTESLLFFGSIEKMTSEKYFERISTCSSEQVLSDLADQTVTLAMGLTDKMNRIRQSIFYIKAEMVIIGAMIVILALATYLNK